MTCQEGTTRAAKASDRPEVRKLSRAEQALASRMLDAAGIASPRNRRQRGRLMVRAVTLADVLAFSAEQFRLDATKAKRTG